jgi:hypothetical protein
MAAGDPSFGKTLGTPAEEATLLASSLARKIRTYMALRPGLRHFPTAAAWFWHRIQLFLESTEWEVIIAGDFNMPWPAPGPIIIALSPFQKLMADMGLSNQAAEVIRSVGETYLSTCRPDYFMVADRDHILSTLTPGSLRAVAILCDPVWIAGRNHAPIWAGYRIPVTNAPSKPIWEQTDRRIQMEIKKTDSIPMQELRWKTTLWYDSFPPPPVFPLSWKDRNSRLKALQEGLLKVAEETLLKKKKKPSPGRFFFGDFPIPLQLLKIHLYTLVRLRKILDVPLSYHSYNPDGRVKGPPFGDT